MDVKTVAEEYRDELIVDRAKLFNDMLSSGMSLQQVADTQGISRQRVHQIASGYQQIKSTKWYKILRHKAMARDNFQCVKCNCKGSDGNKLIIHHIDGDNHNNHIDNLVTLCNKCHSSTHFKGVRYVEPKYYICNQCGKCFECHNSTTKSKLFCSSKCSRDYHNITLFCEVCNKKFTRYIINIIRNVKQGRSNGDHIFCSKKCQGVWFGGHGRKRKFNWDDAYDLYKKGLSYKEIADMFNVSREAISQAVKKIESTRR